MAGKFELFTDANAQFRFRLTGPEGDTVVLSVPYADKQAAVRGITAVRECAGTGLITDLSAKPAVRSESTAMLLSA